MAAGAAAQAAERRILDASIRTINDHPRKKRRRGIEYRPGLRLLEEERVWRPENPAAVAADSFVVRSVSPLEADAMKLTQTYIRKVHT